MLKIKKLYIAISFATFQILALIFIDNYLAFGLSKSQGLVNVVKDLGEDTIKIVIFIVFGVLSFIVAFIAKNYINLFEKLGKFKINYKIILILSFLILAIGFSALAITKHYRFQTGLFDFGLEHQVVWNTSQGRIFDASVEVNNYLGDHFSPIIAILAVIYKIFPFVEVIFILQVLCVAVAALGVYFLAKEILKNKLISYFWSIIFFFFLGISGLLLNEYHPIAFALPLLIWGLYFYEYKSKVRIGMLLLVLATFAKEDVGLLIGTYGIYRIIFAKDKKGVLLFIYGYLISIISLLVLIPFFRGEASDTLIRYGIWGSNSKEIVLNIITQPLNVIKHLLSLDQTTYFFRLFFPFGFLALLSPKRLFIILPNFLINALTNYIGQLSTLNHYDVMTVVGIIWPSLEGFKILVNFLSTKFAINAKSLKVYIILALLFINITVLIGHPIWRPILERVDRDNDRVMIDNLRPNIKQEWIISATNSVGGQFGEFRNLQIFDEDLVSYNDLPDIIVYDYYVQYEKIQTRLNKLKSEYNYKLILKSKNVEVYSRDSKIFDAVEELIPYYIDSSI